MKIFVDAGHRNTQYDFGATNGVFKESEIALLIAQRVEIKLQDAGIITYMSRLDEQGHVSVNHRVKRANDLAVDLYLSIHINSASNHLAHGVETLSYDDKSLGKAIGDAIVKETNQVRRNDLSGKQFAVLRDTKMDAVIVECGFISNLTEAKNLKRQDTQDKIATGIVNGILAHYKIEPPTDDKDDDYTNAINTLIEQGIITSPDLWLPKTKINVKYVPDLIVKFASKISK